MCKICTGKIHNENLITLIELNVSYCPNLTSEKLQEVLIQCKNLTILDCFNCTSLISLDLRNNINLVTLWCSNCTSLTSLDLRSSSEGVTTKGCINLVTLWCFYCASLTSLDLQSNINLKILWCSNCTSLTSLNLQKGYRGNIDCYKCPWICQNEDFINNLQRLIKIQRWYRRILLIKYLKSQEFIEWIYSPNNIGGYLYKKWLFKNLK